MLIVGVVVELTTTNGAVADTLVTVPALPDAGNLHVAIPVASEVRTPPDTGVVAPANLTVPETSSVVAGDVVPIPTCPDRLIVILSVKELALSRVKKDRSAVFSGFALPVLATIEAFFCSGFSSLIKEISL